MATVELGAANFDHTLRSNDIVFVDFWAEWCGPCRQFGPIFEKVSEKYEDIVFGKVNTEVEQDLAADASITAIPTLMVFRKKVLVYNQAGALAEPALEQLIDAVKRLDMAEVHKQVADQATATDSEDSN